MCSKGGVASVAWPTFQILLPPANISRTADDTNQKFSRATSKCHDLLNKQATEALELGKTENP